MIDLSKLKIVHDSGWVARGDGGWICSISVSLGMAHNYLVACNRHAATLVDDPFWKDDPNWGDVRSYGSEYDEIIVIYRLRGDIGGDIRVVVLAETMNSWVRAIIELRAGIACSAPN